ncbi:hypothetical protein [Actinospica acidithermotolerans]|uniref:hypothetical protein n=1 Tax=Actinospica acidithermotolerans TaxID=2828514 RepID=UPI0020114DA0|nr:hypothetical protein [Actinospica acidithermotolerans]
MAALTGADVADVADACALFEVEGVVEVDGDVVGLGLAAAVVGIAVADALLEECVGTGDPSAVSCAPSGPTVVSQVAVPSAAATASNDSRTVRVVRRPEVRLL